MNLVSAMGANTSYLYLNLSQPPLDNPKVREAIWYVRYTAAVQVAYRNFGQLADGVLNKGIGRSSPRFKCIFLVKMLKAKSLLKKLDMKMV